MVPLRLWAGGSRGAHLPLAAWSPPRTAGSRAAVSHVRLCPAHPQPVQPLEIFASGSALLPAAASPCQQFSKPLLWSWTKAREAGQIRRSPLFYMGPSSPGTEEQGWDGGAPMGAHLELVTWLLGPPLRRALPRAGSGLPRAPGQEQHQPGASAVLKPSKDLAAQVRNQGWVSIALGRAPCPAYTRASPRGDVGTSGLEGGRRANRSSFLQEQLPRTWTCSHLATLQHPCQPRPLGHNRAGRAETVGPRAGLRVPPPADPCGPSKPSSACSEPCSILSLSRPRRAPAKLRGADTEQPQSRGCVRAGHDPAEPLQPMIYFLGGRRLGQPRGCTTGTFASPTLGATGCPDCPAHAKGKA